MSASDQWSEQEAGLLGRLYECPFEGSWTGFLDRVEELLDGVYPALLEVDKSRGASSLHSTSSFPDSGGELYSARFGCLDPFAHEAAKHPPGTVLSTERMPQIPWAGTEFYEEYVTRLGIDHVMGAVVLDSADAFYVFSFYCSAHRQESLGRDEEQLLRVGAEISFQYLG